MVILYTGTFIVAHPMSLIYLNFFTNLVCFGLFFNASLIGKCIQEEKVETMALLSSSEDQTIKSVGNKSGK